MPQYSNKFTVQTFSRVMTGAAIPLSSTSRFAFKAWIIAPAANAANVTWGGSASSLPFTWTKGTQYEFEPSHADTMRIDLADIYVNGTASDTVVVMYVE